MSESVGDNFWVFVAPSPREASIRFRPSIIGEWAAAGWRKTRQWHRNNPIKATVFYVATGAALGWAADDYQTNGSLPSAAARMVAGFSDDAAVFLGANKLAAVIVKNVPIPAVMMAAQLAVATCVTLNSEIPRRLRNPAFIRPVSPKKWSRSLRFTLET